MIKERIIIQKEIPDTYTAPGTLPQHGWLVRPIVDVSLGLMLLRLLVGGIFIAHGAQKVLGAFGGTGLAGTAASMANMGIPEILAYTAAFTEFFGGMALIVGLLTRLASLGLTITMGVAIVMVHLSKGFFAPAGYEYPLLLGGTALVLFLVGPGRYSLDEALSHKRTPNSPIRKVNTTENIRVVKP